MVQEQYVSYETAVLLNEVGFPQGCSGKRCFSNGQALHEDVPLYGELVRVPHQDLATKWLRDEKKLAILIRMKHTSYEYNYVVYEMTRDDGCSFCVCHGQPNDASSYEQTVEKAIVDACKYLRQS